MRSIVGSLALLVPTVALAQTSIPYSAFTAGGVIDGGNILVLGQPFVGLVTTPINAEFGIVPLLRSSCVADFNNDGAADFFDYLDFVSAFDAEAVAADFNRDGAVDFFDYLDFVSAFDVGCD